MRADRSNRRTVTAFAGLLAWALIALPPRAEAQGGYDLADLKALETTFTQLADTVRPNVVAIRTYRTLGGGSRGQNMRETNSHGSGVIVRADGLILTNEHVLADADVIKVVLHDGSEHEAWLVQSDVRSDMAVIKAQGAAVKPARLGDASDLRVGQWCFAVGNPFGIGYDGGGASVSFGNVEGLSRNLSRYLDNTDTRYYGDLIETTADINPGNSGGPLYNLEGEVIGLVTAIVSRSGVSEGRGFAIPIDSRTRRIIDALVTGQEVRYGYLGVEVRTARDAVGSVNGALISQLSDHNGPAARADLRPDDLIVEFDGVPIQNSDHLVRLVGSTPVGSNAHVRYVRGGQPRTTSVTVAERPGVHAVRDEEVQAAARSLPWRGAVLAEMDEATLRRHGLSRSAAGVVVAGLENVSEARSAGLKNGDVIFSYNGDRVRSLAEFIEADEKGARAIKLELKGGRTIRMRR